MKIFVKQAGEDRVQVTVAPSDTVESLKMQLQLKSVSLRLGQVHLKNSATMEQAGVQEGNTLMAFTHNKTPKGFESRSRYLADRNLKTGRTQRSVAHKDLHQQTQAVVLQESAHLAHKIDVLGQKVDDLAGTFKVGHKKICLLYTSDAADE